MRKLSVLLLCLAVIARFSVPAFSLTVIPADSAEALAYSLAGPGITISDVSFTGNLAAAGYFSDGPAETGLEKGTVLTTGFASNLNGTSNTSDEITGVNNTAGDPGLDAMIPGYSTFDAAVLSFDFIPSYLRETHWNSVIYSARKNITNTLTRITMTFSVSSSTVSITRLFRKQTLRFQSAV